MEVNFRNKCGNDKAVEKYIKDNYEYGTFSKYYILNFETLAELSKFMREVVKVIKKDGVNPIFCPLDEESFELRFE